MDFIFALNILLLPCTFLFSLSRVKPYEALNYPPTESFLLPQALGLFLFRLKYFVSAPSRFGCPRPWGFFCFALHILCQHRVFSVAPGPWDFFVSPYIICVSTESFRMLQALGAFFPALNILCQHYGINVVVVL